MSGFLQTWITLPSFYISLMYIPMADEGRFLSEAFLTLEALMWLFPSVGFLVGTEVGSVVEAFPTLGTLIQALQNVGLPVSTKWELVDSLSQTVH